MKWRQPLQLEDGYVPIDLFGKDHWSTLAYAETCLVDRGGFQVGFDARMRQGRAHFRVMARDCPRPKHNRGGPNMGMVMAPEHSTILKDGSVVQGHDDWHCVQDLVNAGLMGAKVPNTDTILPLTDAVEPGMGMGLTPLGQRVIGQLRAWKAFGGGFGDFAPQIEAVGA
jgi:hypothetical protein